MTDREIKVKLIVEQAEFLSAMKRARKAARKLQHALDAVNATAVNVNVERGEDDDSVSVRSGEKHGIPEAEATVDQWEVAPLPTTDFAARALREAQEKWERGRINYGSRMGDLIWHLRKRSN